MIPHLQKFIFIKKICTHAVRLISSFAIDCIKFIFTNTEGWLNRKGSENVVESKREALLLKFINNNLLFKESFVL